MKPRALFFLVILLISTDFVRGNRNTGDPYKVLGVPRDASQEEIKKRYRELCLKYHPDKNVNKSLQERKRCEEHFKSIQQSNDMIGDQESRALYDRMRTSPFSSGFATTSTSHGSQSAGSDPVAEAFYRWFGLSPSSGSFSSFSSNGPGFRATFSTSFPPRSNPFDATTTTNPFSQMGDVLPSFKSIYVQKVKVPLRDLYSGAKNVQLKVKDSLWKRYRAAFRGGAAYLNLYQGLIYAVPTIRFSRCLALIILLSVFHNTLPRPQQSIYQADFAPGSKGGKTQLRFKSSTFGQPEIIFEVEEEDDKRYKRIGNDLHTTVTISSSQAKKGCTLSVKPLDMDESPTELRLGPNQIQGPGGEIRVKGKGWPIRHTRTGNENEYGDLIVRILVKPSGRRKNRKKSKRKG